MLSGGHTRCGKMCIRDRGKAVKGREKNHAGGQNFSPLMVQIADDEPDNHGDDAGNDICYGEVAHAGGAQCNHGKKGPVIEGKDRGGSHICFITKFACQGGIDDAVGIGYGSDDSQGRQSQEPCFAEQCIEQKPQAETDKELKGGEDRCV